LILLNVRPNTKTNAPQTLDVVPDADLSSEAVHIVQASAHLLQKRSTSQVLVALCNFWKLYKPPLQVIHSDRRARELAFECLCEYTKLNAMGAQYRHSCVKERWSQIVVDVCTMRWKRFGQVLETYLTAQQKDRAAAVTCEVVHLSDTRKRSNRLYVQAWEEIKRAHPCWNWETLPSILLHIRAPHHPSETIANEQVVRVHTLVEDLASDLTCECDGFPGSQESHDTLQCEGAAPTILCAQSVRWLHPPSYCCNLFAKVCILC
jgi:hypothetical protein